MQYLLGSSVSWVWPMGGTSRRPGSLEKERVGSFLPPPAVLGLHLPQFQPQVLLISPSFESPGSLGSPLYYFRCPRGAKSSHRF